MDREHLRAARARRPGRRSVVDCLALSGVVTAASACFGQVGALDTPTTQTAPSGTDGGALAVGDGWTPRVVVPVDTPLHRLSRTEYDNTLRDLLGANRPGALGIAMTATSDPVAALPSDLPTNPLSTVFDNEGDLLAVDTSRETVYFGAAESLIDTALAAGSSTRARIVACDPTASGAAGTSCVTSTIQAFARRAWRRPPTSSEVADLVALAQGAVADGDDLEAGLRLSLAAVITSANFLYHVEIDPPGTTGPHAVSPHELASRLSYFLWSSMPDDELLERADDGTLAQPTVLAAQVTRMLADPKSSALVDNFAAQWFDTIRLDGVQQPDPDATLFPGFDVALRGAMLTETSMFVSEFLHGDHDALDMLSPGFTYANAPLARYYGLPPVDGAGFQRVALAGSARVGLLTQGSVLLVTSHSYATSPTQRGAWALARLLCTTPPPKPNGVPALADEDGGVAASAPLRDRLHQHETDPSCSGCHLLMDPMGFGLEHFDAAAVWRDAYPGGAIDATGTVPGGAAFDGAASLAAALHDDPRVPACIAQRFFGFALGRVPASAADQAALANIGHDFASQGRRMSALVRSITSTPSFLERSGGL